MAAPVGVPPPTYGRDYRCKAMHDIPDKCKECDSKAVTECGASATEGLVVHKCPDKGGNWHHHDDMNHTSVEYKCDKGHQWSFDGYYKCWCGWNSRTGHPQPMNPLHEPDLDWVNPDRGSLPADYEYDDIDDL